MIEGVIKCQPQPEYVYITIPAEYVCVYHKIMAMMADFGEDMLKDCKASCTDRNSSVIECYNMFNAAISARTIGKGKLAETIIHYIKAKINQIYKGKEGVPGFVFPIDEKGMIKAFVSCNDRPMFYINPDDGVLYKQTRDLGVPEEYYLDKKDKPYSDKVRIPVKPPIGQPFDCYIIADFDVQGNLNVDITYYFEGKPLDEGLVTKVDYYFDNIYVNSFSEVNQPDYGEHIIRIVAEYKSIMLTKTAIVVRKLTE